MRLVVQTDKGTVIDIIDISDPRRGLNRYQIWFEIEKRLHAGLSVEQAEKLEDGEVSE